MPYPTLADLPDAVKKLPKHAQEIYQKSFNSAFEQYKDRGKQREALSHATAWAAVEKQYEKKNGRWVAKEAKMVIKEAQLSDENKRHLLQQGLTTEYGLDKDDTIPRGIWVEDVFENKVIYNVNGQTYSVTYKMEEDGKPTFGEPEKVVRQTTYKAMESLQTTYSEILQEAGRRNATLDSVRIKKIVALCQELLSSEDEPDEKKSKEALKEATSVLKLIKEQAVMKTEDGIKFPAAAYAYVGDPEKSTTWKLRLWEDPTKKVTRAQLGRAAA
ncbi:ChaB family protein, partial [bacterium]|nr:ChaB family protein [bacterium]